jgi:hypothetical protein
MLLPQNQVLHRKFRSGIFIICIPDFCGTIPKSKCDLELEKAKVQFRVLMQYIQNKSFCFCRLQQ